MSLTAAQKLKQLIIYRATDGMERLEAGDAIDARYEELDNEDALQDYSSELRYEGEQTYLSDRYSSRHYECHEVAAEMLDGSFVGWTYWYGGGKHGEPGVIEWIEDAYDVVYGEETRTVKVWSRK